LVNLAVCFWRVAHLIEDRCLAKHRIDPTPQQKNAGCRIRCGFQRVRVFLFLSRRRPPGEIWRKLYWYGAGTEIRDESDGSGNITNEYVFFGGRRIAMDLVSSGSITSTYYYAEDFLGSSRTMLQSGASSPCFDADFLPFGREKDAVATCTQNDYKFEGKERDTETGNDDFGARYYSSNFGRWLSPDWSSIPAPVPYANLTNPQTLNLYAMVQDNPESFADLDGHDGNQNGNSGQSQDCNVYTGNACTEHELQFLDSAISGYGTGGLGPMNPDQIFSALEAFLKFYNDQESLDAHAPADPDAAQQQQSQAAQGSVSAQNAQQLNAVKVDHNQDYLNTEVDWKLSNPSKDGGWVVQHVAGDWNKNSTNVGHWDYWEAWYISPGKEMTQYHVHAGFDDSFSGGFGTRIHAEARFYEGLKLPSAFRVNSVAPAGDLRAVLNSHAPALSTTNATSPFVRDWNP
jgi:RHS repeat-associated protein